MTVPFRPIDPLVIHQAAVCPASSWEVTRVGFAHITVDDVRVTVWHSALKMEDSVIHNHPWGYRSTVYTGSLRETVYDVSSILGRGEKYRKHVFVDGKLIPLGDCWVTPYDTYVHTSLRSYTRAAHEFHEVFPEDGTITLLQKGERVHQPTILTKDGHVRDAYAVTKADRVLYQERSVALLKEAIASK